MKTTTHRRVWSVLYTVLAAILFPAVLHADAAAAGVSKIDSGDTAWVLISTGLVLLMIPALAFFYGGLVRRKNMLSVLQQCMMALGLITLQWVFFGYSLAFGPDKGGWIGDFSWAFLKGVGQAPNPDYASTIPHLAFMIFQAMFAIITPALIIGAFAERMKFSSYCLFILIWATLVYDPVCHWVWAVGGLLHKAGALDFAGGTVVHINAGAAALASALILKKRIGFPHKIPPPHNLPFAVLGAGLLWFGWFGFNGGSALAANGLAVNAIVASHIAAAAAGLTWVLLDWYQIGHMTMLGMITGLVAGLVAITPAAGFVSPMGAVGIGITAAMICYASVAFMKPRFGYDDTLDAFGVHGVGGVWGSLATGLWATKSVNPAGADGLFYGNPAQFIIQAKATLMVAAYSFIASYCILKVLDSWVGMRVTERQERIGLDLTQHQEAAYTALD